MARIRIVASDDVAWRRTDELVEPATAAVMSRAEREADVRMLHAGADGGLQLFEARIAADETIALHAHAEDEIIYVLEGELRIGRKRLGPGTSLFVAGNTLYGFSTGSAGVRFLNFRGRANTSFIPREAFLAGATDGDSAS
ncbi:MAG: cupin domain-containing protein [Gammaproteobacteria bacterium]